MKNTVNRLALLLGVIAATTLSATAQDGPGRGGRGPGGPGARGPREVPAEILKEFDKDKDGKLNEKEREAAAAARKAKWEAMTQEERERSTAMGITDFDKVYNCEEMAAGEVVFAATGVTNGELLRGVRYFSGGAETHSVVMRSKSRTVRFIQAQHHFDYKPNY